MGVGRTRELKPWGMMEKLFKTFTMAILGVEMGSAIGSLYRWHTDADPLWMIAFLLSVAFATLILSDEEENDI